MKERIQSCINKIHLFSSRLHMFHWNVSGEEFISLHKFFEECYKELLEQKDVLAEHLRFLDHKALIDFENILSLNKNFSLPEDASKMLRISLEDYKILLSEYKELSSDFAIDRVISDFFPQIEKRIYFIESMLR